MSDIDHKGAALFLIEGLHDYQSEEGQTDASLLTVAIEAQVHATLCLAEQQKRSADAAEKQNVALASIVVTLSAGLSHGQQLVAARGIAKIEALA